MLNRIITNPALRSFLRRVGILTLLKKLMGMRASAYEDRFATALLGCIRKGDVVWDIGANIGFYTTQLARSVGPNGRVVAFEPVSTSFNRMVAAVKADGLNNVLPVQSALGHCEEKFSIPVTTVSDGVTNSLAKKTNTEGTCMEEITVSRGDKFIADGVPAPTIIKIDVEAYEEEVVFGLRSYLQGGCCRELFCEIHFGQLAARGSAHASRRIESLLLDSGYVVRWLDASHIQATRTLV